MLRFHLLELCAEVIAFRLELVDSRLGLAHLLLRRLDDRGLCRDDVVISGRDLVAVVEGVPVRVDGVLHGLQARARRRVLA